tara:strand:- start:11958 stop:12266 length:309 start_codon:yes stop_codon:yes gene_type:complete
MSSYKITPYSKKQAKRLGVIIKVSTNKKKKIDVFDKKGNKIVSIGGAGYLDYPNYILKYTKEFGKKKGMEKANARRSLYKKRHEKDRHKKGSAGYYADQILW